MAKIHGMAYLILGIIIFSLSYYIHKNIQEKFGLFVYVGLLMIIIGTIKLAAQSIKNRKQTKKATHHTAQRAQHPATHRVHQKALYCQRCGAILKPSNNFCYNCGNRIIHHRR